MTYDLLRAVSQPEAMRASSALVGAGALISALEDWRNLSEFDDSGIMSWRIARLDLPIPRTRVGQQIREILCCFETFRIFSVVRILAAIVLIVWSTFFGTPAPILTGILLLSIVQMTLRTSYGLDGADQMSIVLLAGLLVAESFPPGRLGGWFGLWFVAAQVTLSYTVSGVAKMLGPRWRDGSGLTGVVSTYSYGFQSISLVFQKYPSISLVASWSVMTWETSFAVVWLVPLQGALLYLVLGVIFHLGVALIMGLNNFVFAFVGTYPIVYFCLIGAHAQFAAHH